MDLSELERRKDELEHRIAERERHLLVLVDDARHRIRRAGFVAGRVALVGVALVGLWTTWRVTRGIGRTIGRGIGQGIAAWRYRRAMAYPYPRRWVID